MAPKIVFLAGAPGSGKNYVADKIFGKDFELVSADVIYEKLLKAGGYGTDISKLPTDQQEYVTTTLREQSRTLMKQQLAKAINDGKNIIFDGTGQVPSSYAEKKNQAAAKGYDAHCIFVDVPLETALKRNDARERKLPHSLVAKIFTAVEQAKPGLKKIFGDKMYEVNNSDGVNNTNLFKQISDNVNDSSSSNKDEPSTALKDLTPTHIKSQMQQIAKAQIPNDQGNTSQSTPETIHNPETGNNIQIKSAMTYPPDHPMHKRAEEILKRIQGRRGK